MSPPTFEQAKNRRQKVRSAGLDPSYWYAVEYDRALATVNAWNASPAQKLPAQRLLDDAAHNIRLIKLGHGVHNVNYATAALNVALERSREANRLAGAGP